MKCRLYARAGTPIDVYRGVASLRRLTQSTTLRHVAWSKLPYVLRTHTRRGSTPPLHRYQVTEPTVKQGRMSHLHRHRVEFFELALSELDSPQVSRLCFPSRWSYAGRTLPLKYLFMCCFSVLRERLRHADRCLRPLGVHLGEVNESRDECVLPPHRHRDELRHPRLARF